MTPTRWTFPHRCDFTRLLRRAAQRVSLGYTSRLDFSGARSSTALPALLDAPMTSDAAAFPSVHNQEPGVPDSSSVRSVRGSTAGPHSRSSPPVQPAREQLQLPVKCRQLYLQPHQHHPGQLGRQRYLREGPPPLVDAEGQVRWIVDRIVGHEDPPREATSLAHETRAVPSARKYRIRWLGFPPEQGTWEPRSSLLHEVPDVVRAYESMKPGYPDATAEVNVLVMNENGEAIHCVENENGGKNGNVVVNVYHHDHVYENENENENVVVNVFHHGHENETSTRAAQQDGAGERVAALR